jgi:pyruvate kinase
VCTLGPASSSEPVLRELILAGMDMVRLNFSHGTHEEMEAIFSTVRRISSEFSEQVHFHFTHSFLTSRSLARPPHTYAVSLSRCAVRVQVQVSILCDIQGPKIRTGKVKEPFNVDVGDHIDVTPDSMLGTPECVQIKYPHMMEDLDVGDKIFINDGIVKLRVESKGDRRLSCVVEAGGQIADHKGCNIPKGKLSLNIITDKDKVTHSPCSSCVPLAAHARLCSLHNRKISSSSRSWIPSTWPLRSSATVRTWRRCAALFRES